MHSVGAEQVSRDTLEAFYQVPAFIYSYEEGTNQLHRTYLVTGERSSHLVPCYTFKTDCCWSEVTGGSLLITGGWDGDFDELEKVVMIDTRREFAVAHWAPMLTPRAWHPCSVSHSTSLRPWRMELQQQRVE
jgi:hypothetical protein